jgi:hypothetical protein
MRSSSSTTRTGATVRAANRLFAGHVPGFELVRALRSPTGLSRPCGTASSSTAGAAAPAPCCRHRPATRAPAVVGRCLPSRGPCLVEDQSRPRPRAAVRRAWRRLHA